jgi:hypothetical protein
MSGADGSGPRWRACAHGRWHDDPAEAAADALGWRDEGAAASWVEENDGAQIDVADVQRVADADAPPPGGFVTTETTPAQDAETARVLWRAVDEMDLDGVLAALAALDAPTLRWLVLVRALLDRKDRASRAGT